MTHMLMTLADGKIAVCLEGGYNFRSISKSALAVTKTLMGEPPDRLMNTIPTEAAKATVGRVMNIQAHHWRCMFPKPPSHPVWADRLHGMLAVPPAHEQLLMALQTSFVTTSPSNSTRNLNSPLCGSIARQFPNRSRTKFWQGKRWMNHQTNDARAHQSF